MVDLLKSQIKSWAPINRTKSIYCIFPTIIPQGCEVDGVWRKMVVCNSTLANYSHQSTFLGENGGVFWDFLTRVSLGGERGNFLTRVSFQRRTGDISICDLLFNGARMRTCYVHGHWLFIFSQWRTAWFCIKENIIKLLKLFPIVSLFDIIIEFYESRVY